MNIASSVFKLYQPDEDIPIDHVRNLQLAAEYGATHSTAILRRLDQHEVV
jgi:hypothetical protein